jgi:uncharacterized protein (DUF2252 family)
MARKDENDFERDNAAFEAWLRQQCKVDETGLTRKHAKMNEGEFSFLRATYFRWAKTIEDVCPELARAPKVLAVGDIHIENFGTWRNVEQRLVWGINDFDEAADMPYAFDLVRLVTSARLTPDKKIRAKAIARAVLGGYRRGLKAPGPILLEQQQTWMNEFLRTTDEERAKFRTKYETPNRKDKVSAREMPPDAKRGLIDAMPKGLKEPTFAKRTAGAGSLGRPRFVAVADWCGGLVVREAKAQVPSAWEWAHGRPKAKSRLIEAAQSKSRSPDPYLEADGRYVFRRLAADADKIEIKDLDEDALQADLFGAMGYDLGSFHGGDRVRARAILNDLRRRGSWLHHAADQAEAKVRKDFAAWQAVMAARGKKTKTRKS